jgi:hypothetical protein
VVDILDAGRTETGVDLATKTLEEAGAARPRDANRTAIARNIRSFMILTKEREVTSVVVRAS